MHKEQYRNILVDIRKALKEQFVIEDSLLASESEALFFQKQPDKKPLMASLSVPVVPPLPAREKISSVEKQVPPPKEEQIKIAPIPEPSKPTLSGPLENQSEWSTLAKRVAPRWALASEIPSDEEAKRIANRWKESFSKADVAVIYFDENEKELSFLKNLTTAIHTRLTTAELVNGKKIDEEKKWDLFIKDSPMKLVLASPSLQKAIDMKRYYKELPSTSERLLANTPLIFLAPLASYFKDPAQKQALWKTLCQRLQS